MSWQSVLESHVHHFGCGLKQDFESRFEEMMRRRTVVPRNSREMQARERALKALWSIRQGDSLSKAARDNGVTARTIKRYVGSALVQDRPGRRIRATKSDRLVRYLQIPGPNGPRDVNAHGLKVASEFAKYKAAVNRLLAGDRDALKDWQGKKIAGIELVTDTKTLVEQAHQEMLPYSLYRFLSGGAA